MSSFHDHVADYLKARRALGFKLAYPGLVLPQFAAYLKASGAEVLTVELAVAWAGMQNFDQSMECSPVAAALV